MGISLGFLWQSSPPEGPHTQPGTKTCSLICVTMRIKCLYQCQAEALLHIFLQKFFEQAYIWEAVTGASLAEGMLREKAVVVCFVPCHFGKSQCPWGTLLFILCWLQAPLSRPAVRPWGWGRDLFLILWYFYNKNHYRVGDAALDLEHWLLILAALPRAEIFK